MTQYCKKTEAFKAWQNDGSTYIPDWVREHDQVIPTNHGIIYIIADRWSQEDKHLSWGQWLVMDSIGRLFIYDNDDFWILFEECEGDN